MTHVTEPRTERESMAVETAMSNYGIQLEGMSRQDHRNRLTDKERDAFDAGWEAAKQYYKNQGAL